MNLEKAFATENMHSLEVIFKVALVIGQCKYVHNLQNNELALPKLVDFVKLISSESAARMESIADQVAQIGQELNASKSDCYQFIDALRSAMQNEWSAKCELFARFLNF